MFTIKVVNIIDHVSALDAGALPDRQVIA